MADEMIDEEGLRRSARSQIIVDTIERSLEKMMFVESNIGKEMESKDLFQVKRDPVMPGCLGLDAMWQLVGFFLGWKGEPGKGRALGVNSVKFSGEVLKNCQKVFI